MNSLGEGLFGIFMTFVILAGTAGLAWVFAYLSGRGPKCVDCGMRQGHRMDCKILDQLVETADAREFDLIARVKSGELTIAQAMELLK